MNYKIDVESIITVKLITKSHHMKMLGYYSFFPLLCLITSIIRSNIDPDGIPIIYYIVSFLSAIVLIKPIKNYLKQRKLIEEGPLYEITYKDPNSPVGKLSGHVRGDVIGLPTSYDRLTKNQYESLTKGYKR